MGRIVASGVQGQDRRKNAGQASVCKKLRLIGRFEMVVWL